MGGVRIRIGGGRRGFRRGPGFRRGFGWRRRGWGWRRRRPGVVVVGGGGYYGGGGCGPGVMMVPFCIIGLLIAVAVIGSLTGTLSSGTSADAVDCTTPPQSAGCESSGSSRCWTDLYWTDLDSCEQGYWSLLTYNSATWDSGENPAAATLDYTALANDQQEAVLALGYTESSWDASNGNGSASSTTIILVILAAVMCCCVCVMCNGGDDDDEEEAVPTPAVAAPAPAMAVPVGTPMMANTPGFVPINGGKYPVQMAPQFTPQPMYGQQPMMAQPAQPMMAQPAMAVPVGQPAMAY